ncbi:MAG: class I SAM-dependent methyltransferase [Methylococcaceae bacterium]|nr:class I SAM-dependent methyltransferase [Methylococcaceae bacterium]
MTSQKPFSQACENNKDPILQVISRVFSRRTTVWEIGSGTGQHACHFARHLPHVDWQPTDRRENIPGIRLWMEDAQLGNLKPPLCLDVTDEVWPCDSMGGLFTANTLHIMSRREVELFFDRLGVYLNAEALICIYGPFNYDGRYTSDSNARFDEWLKSRNALSGIKDFEYILSLATSIGLSLQSDTAMPANNRLLVLKKGVS